ncbi:hypothetical protein L596_001046 [Steinernema carpocapsae]|uniref:Uncharacterized protein n=1 Tax=Steinernema carpocapsae TaxID=34508 RepID=A0A4U8UMG2_STECR|nr:hypothetical protein L596_001046 [Steinernema carpocapsae]
MAEKNEVQRTITATGMDLCAIFEVLLIGDQKRRNPASTTSAPNCRTQKTSSTLKESRSRSKSASWLQSYHPLRKLQKDHPGFQAPLPESKFQNSMAMWSISARSKSIRQPRLQHRRVRQADEDDAADATPHRRTQARHACFFNEATNLKTHGKSSWNASETSNS